jgi:hypothetical protein
MVFMQDAGADGIHASMHCVHDADHSGIHTNTTAEIAL